MSFSRQELGRRGENLAVQLLKQKGHRILARNKKSNFGEIDILTEYKKMIVLVEVKTKRGRLFGLPQEMVHRHKQHKLRQLALWLTQQYPTRTIRVDVVAVDYFTTPPTLEHLEGILEG